MKIINKITGETITNGLDDFNAGILIDEYQNDDYVIVEDTKAEKEAKLSKMIDFSIPFWMDMIDETKNMNVNTKPMSRGMWNLILSKRDCSLYSKGIKPHRNWKITDVKRYFGIKGSASEMAEQLNEIYTLITETNQTENK